MARAVHQLKKIKKKTLQLDATKNMSSMNVCSIWWVGLGQTKTDLNLTAKITTILGKTADNLACRQAKRKDVSAIAKLPPLIDKTLLGASFAAGREQLHEMNSEGISQGDKLLRCHKTTAQCNSQ